jgi:predicted amidohydrolase
MTRLIRIAAAQYDLSALESLADYEAKITRWVEGAVAEGAEVLVFPEYGAIELSAIGNRGAPIATALDAVSALIPEIDRVHAGLAARHRVTIVAGSAPERRGAVTVNTAHIFGPTGRRFAYDKIMPTPGERVDLGISGGRQLFVFDTGHVRLGLVICYDIEFPLLSRALAEAGAEVILAPSDTETEWGYWRVRTGALARALENQVYTVHAPLVGPAPFSAVCPQNTGAAGIFAPSDKGFPPGGVVALGEMGRPSWVHATLDLDRLADVRRTGNVQTFRHWPEQPGAGVLPRAEVVSLTG